MWGLQSSTPGKSMTSIPLTSGSRLYTNGTVVRLDSLVPDGTYTKMSYGFVLLDYHINSNIGAP